MTFENNFIYFYEIEPQGDVQLHAMNFDGTYESIPATHATEEYLGISNNEEVKCQTYYPNPSSGNLNFKWNCSLEVKSLHILFYNNTGQVMSEYRTRESVISKEINIDISNLPKGIYQVVTIINEDEKYTESLIIQ